MVMSEVSGRFEHATRGALDGCRILIAGATGDLRRELCEALADSGSRVARTSDMVSISVGPSGPEERYREMLAATQHAVAELGGIDGIVTVVELDPAVLRRAVQTDAVEAVAHASLAGPLAALRVALNRMETTWIEGALVTVLVIPAGLTTGEALVARIIRAMLADITRHEAERAAELGISVSAVVVDRSSDLGCEEAATVAAVSTVLRALSPTASHLNGLALEVDSVESV